MKKILCKWCEQEFSPQRSTAIFCKDTCRYAWHNEQARQALEQVRNEVPIRQPTRKVR